MEVFAIIMASLLIGGLSMFYLSGGFSKPLDIRSLRRGDIVYYVGLNGIKRVGQLKSRNKELVVKWLRGEGWITLDLLLRDLKLNDIKLEKL
jgi:hypothetical protein